NACIETHRNPVNSAARLGNGATSPRAPRSTAGGSVVATALPLPQGRLACVAAFAGILDRPRIDRDRKTRAQRCGELGDDVAGDRDADLLADLIGAGFVGGRIGRLD